MLTLSLGLQGPAGFCNTELSVPSVAQPVIVGRDPTHAGGAVDSGFPV